MSVKETCRHDYEIICFYLMREEILISVRKYNNEILWWEIPNNM